MRQPSVVECSVSCPRGTRCSGLSSTHGARLIDSTPPTSTSDGVAGLDRAARLHRGVEARAAQAVDGGGRHARRQAGEQHGHAPDVAVVLAGAVGVAEHDVVDPRRVEAGARASSAAHDVRGEVVRAHAGERAAGAAERRAHRVEDVAPRGSCRLTSCLQLPQRPQLVVGRLRADREVVGDRSSQPGGLARLLGGRRPGARAVSTSSRVSGSGSRMPRSVITLRRAAAAQAEALAVARAAAVADRGDEVDPLDERARALAHDHDHLAAAGGDLRRAARAGQPDLRVRRSRRRSRSC